MTEFKKTKEALVRIDEVINGRAEWAVDGSTSLKLQGLNVLPSDIDILVSEKEGKKIESFFQGEVIRPLSYGKTDKYRSHFCVLGIMGVKVEIMGDLQVFRDGKWSGVLNPSITGIRLVSLGGREIPVVPIECLKSTGYVKERLAREMSER